MDTNAIYRCVKFREELVELLKRYELEISGSNLDDGSMELTVIGESGSQHLIMRDGYFNYETLIRSEDSGYFELIDIRDVLINQCFLDNRLEVGIKNVGIFTNDRDKAIKLIEQNKDIFLRINTSKNDISAITAWGEQWKWIKVSDSSIGNRLKKAFIDRELKLEILENIVFPMLVNCNKNDIKIF